MSKAAKNTNNEKPEQKANKNSWLKSFFLRIWNWCKEPMKQLAWLVHAVMSLLAGYIILSSVQYVDYGFFHLPAIVAGIYFTATGAMIFTVQFFVKKR